ncbi:S-adenosylmethionine decarboxylase family protein [Roseateles sp. UC29_93]|uniref:S-adenosylmethionine decarboxylase family protein n=1 Tax=Roseateles sp. UC29_93 TaxID=3350177 RepID=UPI00366EA8DA
MNGLHLTADLAGCANEDLLTDGSGLARAIRAAAEGAGLSVVGEHWHRFPDAPDGQPGGITGMLLLAESHVALHTWPEIASVTLDVYVCNYGGDNSAKARALMATMVALFAPADAREHTLVRGRLGAEAL